MSKVAVLDGSQIKSLLSDIDNLKQSVASIVNNTESLLSSIRSLTLVEQSSLECPLCEDWKEAFSYRNEETHCPDCGRLIIQRRPKTESHEN